MGEGNVFARDIVQILPCAGVGEEALELVGPKFGIEVHPFDRLAKAFGGNELRAVKNEKGVVLGHA